MTRAQLIKDLKLLRTTIPMQDVPNFNERARTIQNLGGYLLRHLDEIIEQLDKEERP